MTEKELKEFNILLGKVKRTFLVIFILLIVTYITFNYFIK